MAVERVLLRVPEAAEALGISRSRMYELVAAGVMPVVKIGNSTRIPRKELERWVEQQLEQWQRGCE